MASNPCKRFGLVIIKIPKTNIIIPLCPSYSMSKIPQNTMSQTALKHYNQFRSVKTEALVWVQITTNTGNKLKIETTVKEIDQKLLDSITFDVFNIEQQHPSIQDIITLPMTPIINSSFNKHPMAWELIHSRLLHPPDSVMKAMCRHQTLNFLPKHCPKKLNKAPCTICYTEKCQLSSK